MKWLLRTSDDVTDLVLRLMLAVVFFPHGAQKALGWFGGYGLHATLGFFTAKEGIPLVLAVLVIAAEFLGSIGLFVGFLARVAAFGLLCDMVGAILLVHRHMGFFMNWAGKMPAGTEGYEFHLLAIAVAFSVMVRGAGPVSIDRALAGGNRR
jgi:putative oxidoreductase